MDIILTVTKKKHMHPSLTSQAWLNPKDLTRQPHSMPRRASVLEAFLDEKTGLGRFQDPSKEQRIQCFMFFYETSQGCSTSRKSLGGHLDKLSIEVKGVLGTSNHLRRAKMPARHVTPGMLELVTCDV